MRRQLVRREPGRHQCAHGCTDAVVTHAADIAHPAFADPFANHGAFPDTGAFAHAGATAAFTHTAATARHA